MVYGFITVRVSASIGSQNKRFTVLLSYQFDDIVPKYPDQTSFLSVPNCKMVFWVHFVAQHACMHVSACGCEHACSWACALHGCVGVWGVM